MCYPIRILLSLLVAFFSVGATSQAASLPNGALLGGAVVDARAFGVKCDGVSNDTAALLSAVRFAGGGRIVELPAGNCLLDGDIIRLAVSKIHLRGAVSGFIYGPSASGTTLSFKSGTVGITTFARARDTQSIPYVTLENLTIDGNNILTTGFEGGFFSTLINCSFIHCKGQGVRVRNGQTTSIKNCGFNGNGDGLLIESGGTQYITESVFRENRNHGVALTGGGPVRFENCIFESNAGSGVSLTGALNHIQFLECYFEQNDIAKGVAGYQVRADISGASENILFENTVFGSTGLSKVANISSGKVQFINCSQAGDPNASPITRGVGAEVFVSRSFPQYPLSSGIKIEPGVDVDPTAALDFSGIGSLQVGALGISFRNRDFTIGFTIEPNDGNHPTRPVLTGDINGFTIGMTGSSAGMGGIFLARTGQAAFHMSSAVLRNNTPSHVAYSRIAGVGYMYLNGVLIDSFPDRNDYSGLQQLIGSDNISGMNSKLYNFNLFSAGLNPLQVFELWRNRGNARAARLGPLLLDLEFDTRPPTKVLDSVSLTWLTPTGSVSWLNPQPAAIFLDPADQELTFWNGKNWKTINSR